MIFFCTNPVWFSLKFINALRNHEKCLIKPSVRQASAMCKLIFARFLNRGMCDIEDFLEKVLPYNKNYKHHQTWGDHNGAGHVRSFLIKTSQTFPFTNNLLILGTWQQIIFIESDEKPRFRKIYCQTMGE